jgi:hypothetical protein
MINLLLQCLATSGPLARDEMGVVSRASKLRILRILPILPILPITSLQGVFSQQPARPGQPRIMVVRRRGRRQPC